MFSEYSKCKSISQPFIKQLAYQVYSIMFIKVIFKLRCMVCIYICIDDKKTMKVSIFSNSIERHHCYYYVIVLNKKHRQRI